MPHVWEGAWDRMAKRFPQECWASVQRLRMILEECTVSNGRNFSLQRLAVEPLCIQSQKKVLKAHETWKCPCQALEGRDSYCFVHQVPQHDASAHNLGKCAFPVCGVQGFISSYCSTLQVLDHWTSRQKTQIMIQASALSFLKLG